MILYLVPGLLAIGCTSHHESIEKKAARIHEAVLTIDSHTDSPWYLLQGGFDFREKHSFMQDGSRLDFVRMKEGGLDAVFFAAFNGQRERNEAGYRNAYEKTNATIDSILTHLQDWNGIAELALTPEDARRIEHGGLRAIFIGIENGYALGTELSKIQYFYDKGARYITLCHTKNNDICDSSTDTTEHNGLSTFGREVVAEMNRAGMMIDVSHASDSAFFQVLRLSSVPVIASHSCARALCDNPRNLSDEMLRALARTEGVVQMCILSDYVKTPEAYPQRDSAFAALREKYGNFENLTPEEEKEAWTEWDRLDSVYARKLATVSDAVDHIDHMVQVAGIDYVGIGTDFDGGGGLEDCRDVSELGAITLELVRRGYSEEAIRKIWGGNLLRVMEKAQKKPYSK